MTRVCKGGTLGLGTCFVFALFVGGYSVRARAAEAPGRAEIEKLVGQLEATNFEVRRAAQLRLNSLGGDALPVVEAALADGILGPEALGRLRIALPFLKARARREAPARERLAGEVAQIRAAYDVGPDRSPMWDKEARAAIELFVKLPRGGPDLPAARTAALAAFAKAADLGAEDPLFLTMYHLTVGERFGRGEGPVSAPFDVVIAKLQRADYPPIVKVWAVGRYIGATRQCDLDVWGRTVRDFARAAKTPGMPATELASSANGLFDALGRATDLPDVRQEQLCEAYKEVAPGSHGALAFEGRVLLYRASRAFERGFGGRDGAARQDRFNDSLAQAAEVLEKAWTLDPTDAMPAAMLITCQLGNRGGGRDAVERWFTKAVEADPDCLGAYERKMYALHPAWLGDTFEDSIAFGRDCLATQNGRAGVPMLLVKAHHDASQASGDAKAYYARPDVWADLSGVYEGQLVNYPDDARRRSELANAAAQSGRWDVVRAQFDLLGDRAVADAFGGAATMDYLKQKAARLGGGPTTRTGGAPVGGR